MHLMDGLDGRVARAKLFYFTVRRLPEFPARQIAGYLGGLSRQMIVQINLMHILRARLNGLQGRIQLGHHPVIIGIQGKIAQKMGIGIYGQEARSMPRK